MKLTYYQAAVGLPVAVQPTHWLAAGTCSLKSVACQAKNTIKNSTSYFTNTEND